MLGETPLVPGQLIGSELSPESDLPTLLDKLKTKAARPPVQTAHHSDPIVHTPAAMDKATHLYVKRGKITPLGKRFDGPFPIVERQGNACVKLHVANYANGQPRYEVQHWQNCKIPDFDDPLTATRPALGRPPKLGVTTTTDDQGAAASPYNLRSRKKTGA